MPGRFVLALAVAVGLSVCTVVSQGRAQCRGTPLKACDENVFMTVHETFGERPVCQFRATVLSRAVEAGGALISNGNPLCISSSGALDISLCEMQFDCSASLDTSKGEVECPFNSTSYLALFGSGNADGHAAGNGPVVVTEAELKRIESLVPEDQGGGFLCDGGTGPAVSTRLRNGARILVGLEFRDSLACAPIPWESGAGAIRVLDTCFPVCDGGIELSDNGTVVRLPLTGLEPCPRLMVPTATNWGLIGLVVVLLVGGTWLLRRRRAFAESLSLL